MAGTFGTLAVGSGDAIAGRLLSARQRASALLRQAVIDAERDSCYGRGLPKRRDVAWEARQIREAIALLCQPRPEPESNEELFRRRSAARDFEELEQEGEPGRRMLKEHLELAR
jgi:hypothetical protein